MILYMVGKLVPKPTHFTRGLVKYAPERGCFRAVPSQNGAKFATSPTPPIVERLGSVAADPDNLEQRKEAGREASGSQGLSKNCTNRECVSPLSRLIRGFRNKYLVSLMHKQTRMTGLDCAVMCNLMNTHTHCAS